jgi:glycosyltransferase involved in cell wall biosynthesis
MKIVQTNKAYYPKIGGIETTVRDLSEGFVKNFGADVNVLTCSEVVRRRTFKNLINGVKVEYTPTYGFFASLPLSPGYFKSINEYSGDILHIHEPFPLADISLLLFSKLKNNFSKVVVSWHSDIIRQKWALGFYGKYIFKFLGMVDKIIVSNPNLIKNSDFLPLYARKIEVVSTGVDISWTDSCQESTKLSEKIRTSNRQPIVLFVGRLVYYKGLEYLIDSINMIPDVSLIIIGSGPLKEKIVNKINEMNLSSRVKILPEVEEKKLHSYYKACDLFVLPSVEKSETYGLVQIEAMACGKPVICTELGTGTTYINANNITGLVVPPRDSKQLAEAINKLVNNEEMRKTFGKQGREKVLKELTAEKMVQKTYQVYQELSKKI